MKRHAPLPDESQATALPQNWKSLPIGEIVETQYGLSLAGDPNGNVPILGMKNIKDGKIDPTDASLVCVSDKEIDEYRLRVGDLLFNRTNSLDLVGKTALYTSTTSSPIVFASYLVRLCVDRSLASPDFVCQFLNFEPSQGRLKDMATPGVSQYNINPTTFRNHFLISIPPLCEQEAIGAVLSKWDQAIGQTTALIAAKERRKQGITQHLLTGGRRFSEFRKSKRPLTRLGKVLSKVSSSVDVVDSESYREIGIRCHGKGIFHKEPVSGTSLGNKRVFNILPGCLVLNIVFAWERALAITSDNEVGMIASHRFPMFQPDPKQVLIEYVLHYMLSDVGSNTLQLASPGGAGRNRTISQEQFLKTEIPLPAVEEQKRIVKVINTAESDLRSLRAQLESLKKQKRGLMQQLLTGKLRVPEKLIKKAGKS